MTMFLVQMIAIIVAAIALILLVLEIAGVLKVYTDPDGFWEGSPLYFFRFPMTPKILILAGLIAVGLVTLILTDFDQCSFVQFWFPETRTGLRFLCP